MKISNVPEEIRTGFGFEAILPYTLMENPSIPGRPSRSRPTGAVRTFSSVNSPLFAEDGEGRGEGEEQLITARQTVTVMALMEKLRTTYNVFDLGGRMISFVAGVLVNASG